MCYQRHVRPLARDRSVTTAQHKAVLGTSHKRHWLWLQQPASICSGTLYLFLFHRAEQKGKKEIPFSGEIPQQSVGQKVFFQPFQSPFWGRKEVTSAQTAAPRSWARTVKVQPGETSAFVLPRVPPGRKLHVVQAVPGTAGQGLPTAKLLLFAWPRRTLGWSGAQEHLAPGSLRRSYTKRDSVLFFVPSSADHSQLWM